VDWFILLTSLGVLRLFLKALWENKYRRSSEERKHRVLIAGAGDTGSIAYQTLTAEKNSPFEIVGFIDDAPEKYRKTLHNLKILGNRHNIKDLALLHRIDEVLIAMPSASPEVINRIIEICQHGDLKYRVFTPVQNPNTLTLLSAPIRPLELADILTTKKIKMNYKEVKDALADKTVLITGSGGALGLELCRQMLQVGCKKIIIMERYESYLAELAASLFNLFPKEFVIPVLVASDKIEVMEKAFEKHRPDIVMHTSMRKYVPFFDVSEDDVAAINYLRTFNLANLAVKYQCECFFMISSLVAAKCDSYISVSLRMAEIALIEFFKDLQTRLVITRLCDILESRGGIIQIIENQIRKQETVTLPSPNAQINLLSKYSATEFILQSLANASKMKTQEEYFVCEAGAPVPLIGVASKIGALYHLVLGVDFAVKYVEALIDTITNDQDEVAIRSCFEDVRLIKDNSKRGSQPFKDAIKQFVINSNKNISYKDWEKQTQELLKTMAEAA
jgi:FlaA1/EpsC-like NDP-sugar epimerase